MDQKDSIQSSFLEEVRKKLPPNVSLADDLAEILNISRDSAYRRIRGETVLSLDEVKKLCNHYTISLDNLLSHSSESVAFRHWAVNNSDFTFDKWLNAILGNLTMISDFPEKQLFYSAKDLPVFNYFNFPELSAFKMFFWMKSVLRYPQFQNVKFDTGLVSKEYLALGKKIWDRYMDIPSTELWSEEASNVTLKQIEFCYDSGGFSNVEMARKLCDDYQQMIHRIREWAVAGVKNETGSSFSLYKNEILIGDNILLFKTGKTRNAFIAYNTMSVVTTSQESFCQHIENYIQNLLNKSVMISTVGEKERNKFFNLMDEKIKQAKERLK